MNFQIDHSCLDLAEMDQEVVCSFQERHGEFSH